MHFYILSSIVVSITVRVNRSNYGILPGRDTITHFVRRGSGQSHPGGQDEKVGGFDAENSRSSGSGADPLAWFQYAGYSYRCGGGRIASCAGYTSTTGKRTARRRSYVSLEAGAYLL